MRFCSTAFLALKRLEHNAVGPTVTASCIHLEAEDAFSKFRPAQGLTSTRVSEVFLSFHWIQAVLEGNARSQQSAEVSV